MAMNNFAGNDTLQAAFRELSQKQRNGILHVKSIGSNLQLYFLEGCIISIQKEAEPAGRLICRRLHDAGLLSGRVMSAVESANATVAQLGGLLIEKGYVSAEDYFRAKQAYECDLLYSLKEFQEGEIDFVPKVVSASPDFDLKLFPGTVLLDLLEFEEDELRFEQLFGQASEGKWYAEAAAEPKGLRDENERAVLALLEEGVSFPDICRKSLLCTYHIQQTLLNLYDRGWLNVLSPSAEVNDEGVLLENLSDMLDKAGAEGLGPNVEAVNIFRELQQGEQYDLQQALIGSRGSENTEIESKSEEVRPPAGLRTDELLSTANQFTQAGEEALAQPVETSPSKEGFLRPGRILLLPTPVFIITLISLVLGAVFLPGAFGKWFSALSELTSSFAL